MHGSIDTNCLGLKQGGGISSFEWNQLKPRRASTPTPPLLAQSQWNIVIDNFVLQLYNVNINSSRWLVEVRGCIGGQRPVFFKVDFTWQVKGDTVIPPPPILYLHRLKGPIHDSDLQPQQRSQTATKYPVFGLQQPQPRFAGHGCSRSEFFRYMLLIPEFFVLSTRNCDSTEKD